MNILIFLNMSEINQALNKRRMRKDIAQIKRRTIVTHPVSSDLIKVTVDPQLVRAPPRSKKHHNTSCQTDHDSVSSSGFKTGVRKLFDRSEILVLETTTGKVGVNKEMFKKSRNLIKNN